jgi:ribosome maturation factor RimP
MSKPKEKPKFAGKIGDKVKVGLEGHDEPVEGTIVNVHGDQVCVECPDHRRDELLAKAQPHREWVHQDAVTLG